MIKELRLEGGGIREINGLEETKKKKEEPRTMGAIYYVTSGMW